MTSKPDDILPGLGLAVGTFLTIMALPYNYTPAFWWTMAGISGVTVLLATVAARSSNLLGLFSLAIAAVFVVSMVTVYAAPSGIDAAGYPFAFTLFLVVVIGFPLGVLAFYYPFMSPFAALLAGLCGMIYLPLSLWLSVKLGLTGFMIDVFDPRVQLGTLLGLDDWFGMMANLLGMFLASSVTLLILCLPALPVVMIARSWLGRS
jgi:hypothetical protein